jgi:hypothetical protein
MPFGSLPRSAHGENAEIGSLSDAMIGIIEFMGIVTGPIRRGDGIAPAVALVDPKFPHNVGAAVRTASCYGCGRYGSAANGCDSMGLSDSGCRARSGCADTKKSRSGTRVVGSSPTRPTGHASLSANSAGQVCASKTSTSHRATPLRLTRASAVIKGTWRASAKATY